MTHLPTGSIINDSAFWTLDGLGNTTGYSEGPMSGGADVIQQTRTTNTANQITTIASQRGQMWATPT